MMLKSAPRRHWRSYGNDPLPSPQEALGQPFAAFPSWFLRIECERCGKTQWINQAHMPAKRSAAAHHARPHAP
jgi:hypothetical protein